MKKIILASAIYLFISPAFSACEEFAYNKVFPTTTTPTTILCKNGFAIGYSKEKKTLLWVVERIDPNTNYSIKTRPSFHKDPTVDSNLQSSNSDFVGTGYDKGHMVPFEDMSYSKESAYDSMNFTNVVPQNYQNNRGGWKALEVYARKRAQSSAVYIVSGPLYEGKTDYIGNVPRPTSLYKVIIDPIKKTSKTYILPNTPIAAHEVKDYIKTRSDIVGVITNPGQDLRDDR